MTIIDEKLSLPTATRWRGRGYLRLFTLVGSLVVCAGMNLLGAGLWRHHVVPNGPFRADGGHAWTIRITSPIPFFTIQGDTRANPRQSDLTLSDGAGLLGPAHAAVSDIRKLGGGRYAHWKNRLIFSTRDGADPNRQPVDLTAIVAIKPQGWLLVVSNILGFCAVLSLAIQGRLLARVEQMPLIGVVPQRLRLRHEQVRDRLAAIPADRYRRFSSRLSAVSAVAFLVIAIGAIASRYDLIKVTEDIDFSVTPPGMGAGHDYLVPRNSLYLPFIEVAPIDKKPMTLLIGGSAYPCTAAPGEVGELGGGRCSYSNGYIYVSAPDNGSILQDGRRYAERFPIRVHPYVIYAALALALFFALASRCATSAARWIMFLGGGVLVVGTLLTSANVFGINRSLRSPELATMDGFGVDGTRLGYGEALRQLRWQADDTPKAYATRATLVISEAVSDEYLGKNFDDLHVHIPIWENWILQLMGLTNPELRDYTFWNPRKALQRGVGLCSHVSAMLVTFLLQHGMDARIVGLTGHVVVTAEVAPGQWYIFDPYSGITIPHDLATLERDGAMVRSYYRPVIEAAGLDPASGVGKGLLDLYTHLYTTAGDNRIFVQSDADLDSPYAERERWSYRLKWPLPLAMLGLGMGGIGDRVSPRAAEDVGHDV